MKAQGFPNAVADQIAAVKDGDTGLVAEYKIAINVNQDIVIAFVSDRVVRPVNHFMSFAQIPV